MFLDAVHGIRQHVYNVNLTAALPSLPSACRAIDFDAGNKMC